MIQLAGEFGRRPWLNFAGAVLITLLQRTPALRVLAGGTGVLGDYAALQLVRSVFTLGAVGAVHSLAGATTFLVSQGTTEIIRVSTAPSPAPKRSPATGAVGSSFTPVAFTYTGTPSDPQYFAVTGQLPPGLSFVPAPILGTVRARAPTITGTPTQAGNYTVRVQGFGLAGNGQPEPIEFAITGGEPAADVPRLANLSVRTSLAAGQTLIVGVVVGGGARNVLVRAAGPALVAFGLGAAMADPRLELYNDKAALVFSNNDWGTGPASLAATFASVGAFAFAGGSRDAAFVQSLDAAYSVQVQGTGPGVVLVEAYDTGTPSAARLLNVSARNRVGTGDDILIAGFNIAGTSPKTLLIRAVGPKLGAFGVTGFLADPRLEVYGSGGVLVAENDNWAPALAPTFAAVGAFALDPGSRDAALQAALAPGSYTVQVRGADGGTGEALIEIYEVR